MMRSCRTSAHMLLTLLLGGVFAASMAACSTGGNTGDGDELDIDASSDDDSICGDGTCEPDEINTCEPDCGGGPECNNNDICDAGEVAATCDDCGGGACNFNDICDAGEVQATCADCFAEACNDNGICEGGETPANCPGDCDELSDCGDCDPTDSECVIDFCGEDQACLQACLQPGFDCASLLCPGLGIEEPFCSIFCDFFGDGL